MSTLLGSASGSVELDISGAMKPADQLIGKFKELDQAGAAVGSSGVGIANAAKPMETLDQRATRLKSSFGLLGTGMAVAGGAIAAGFGLGIGAAMDFDAQMSSVQAATGATGDDFDALRSKAMQLGKDTAFSATEGAAAIEELGKAGISVDNIMGGAVDGVVALAGAAGTDLATAAAITAATLNQFGLAGTEATHVADVLARGAQSSAADVTDLGEGMKYVGTAANALGIPVEDTVAALAALSDQAIDGSTAGTSLNMALSSIVAPSEKAAGMMTELGLSIGQTNSLINEDGTFKSLPEIIENVGNATKDLTEVEKQRYINQIFGEQGGRAINALLQTQTEEAKAAGKSWDDYSTGVREGATAADIASTRMDNLSGDFEGFKGTLETVGIVVGSLATGPLRALTQAATQLGNVFLGLPGPAQAAIAGVVGVTGAVAGVGGAALLAYPKFLELQSSFQKISQGTGPASAAVRGLGAAFRFLGASLGPIAIAIAIIALLFLAYQTNFLGFRDLVNGIGTALANAFGPAVSKVIDVLKEIGDTIGVAVMWFQRLRDAGINPVSAAFLAVSMALKSIGGDMTPQWLLTIADLFHVAALSVGRFVQRLTAASAKIRSAVQKIGKVFATDGLMAGFKEIFGKSGQKLLAGFGDALSAPAKLIGDFFKGIQTGIEPLDNVFEAIGQVATTFGRVIQEVFQGDIKGAIDTTLDLFRKWGQLGQSVFDLVGSALRALGDQFPIVGDLMDGLASSFEAFGDIFRAVFSGDLPGILSGLGDLFGSLSDTALAAMDLLWDGIQAGFDAVTGLPWGDIIAGAAGLAGRAFEFAGDMAVAAWNWFKDAIGAIQWSALLDGARDLALVAFRLAGDIAVAAWNWFKAAIGAIPWSALLDGAKDLALVAFRLAGDIGVAAWNWFKAAIGAIPWSAILDGAKNLASVAFRLAGDIGAAAWNWFRAAIGAIQWSELLRGAANLASVAFRLAGDIGEAAWNWFKDAIGRIPWSDLIAGAADLSTQAITAMGPLVEKVGKWVSDAVTAPDWSALISGAADLSTKAIDKMGQLLGKVATWVAESTADVDWGLIVAGAADLSTKAITAMGGLLEKVGGWISGAIPSADKWLEIIGNVGDLAQGAIDKMGPIGEKVAAWIQLAIDAVPPGILDPIVDAFGTVEDAIRGITSAAVTVGGWIDRGVSAIKTALDKLIGATTATLDPIKSALSWLMTNAETAGTTVSTAMGTIKTGLDKVVGLAESALGPIIRLLGDLIAKAQAAKDFFASLNPLGGGDSSGATNYGGGPVDAAGNPVGATGGSNPDDWTSGKSFGQFGTKGLDVANSLAPANALLAKMATIDLSPLAANLGKVAEAMGTVGGKTAAVTLADTAVRKLGTTSTTAATASVSAMNRIGVATATAMNRVSAVTTVAMSRMASVVQSGSQRAANAVQTAANQITSRTSAMASAVASNSQRAGNTLAQNLQSGGQRASAAISNAAGTITGRIQSMASAVAAAGANAGNGLANGIQSGGGRAIGAAQSAASGIIGAFGGAASQAYGLGVSIGQGIGSGIGSQIGYIANQAANAVSTAISAARQAAGNPSSPAPAMVDAVGDPLAEALWMPIKASSRKIQDTAAQAVTDAINAAQMAAASGGMYSPFGLANARLGPSGSVPGGLRGGSSSVRTITYDYSGTTIQVSGAGDPRIVADEVLERLIRGQSSVRRL